MSSLANGAQCALMVLFCLFVTYGMLLPLLARWLADRTPGPPHASPTTHTLPDGLSALRAAVASCADRVARLFLAHAAALGRRCTRWTTSIAWGLACAVWKAPAVPAAPREHHSGIRRNDCAHAPQRGALQRDGGDSFGALGWFGVVLAFLIAVTCAADWLHALDVITGPAVSP